MSGKHHLVMGATTLIATVDTSVLLSKKILSLNTLLTSVKDFVLDNQSLNFWMFIGISTFLYFLGCILPDIDYPYSMIGKIIYIPIEHRTWTHAIWIPAICFIFCLKFRYLFWLGLGMLVHNFWDSFSHSGIHWFYPINSKKHNHIKLYSINDIRETIIVVVSIFVSIFLSFFVLQSTYHFINISF